MLSIAIFKLLLYNLLKRNFGVKDKDVNNFLISSQTVGKNFDLIQGAGGNTSFKEGGFLNIKASGFKLKDSLTKDIFVQINLNKLLKILEADSESKYTQFLENSTRLRPSIETSMHAILPQKYIFHLHCLNQ